MSAEDDIFDRLAAVIAKRKADPPVRSYTNSLLEGGVEKIGAKILEEAAEVVEAASEPGTAGCDHLVHEAADLVYHLWVLLGSRDIPLTALREELNRRFGTSGIDEKESRRESK